MDQHRRCHKKYLDYGLKINKIAGDKKEASYSVPNIQLVWNKNNKIDNISLINQSDKSIKDYYNRRLYNRRKRK